MSSNARTAPWFGFYAVACLLAIQGLAGLAMPWLYRDHEPWILATWRGNDAVTALVAAPLLGGAAARGARGSTRGWLIGLGVLGYALYNGAYYLFGAALGVFFPLYVAIQIASTSALFVAVRALEMDRIAAAFGPRTPRRSVGAVLLTIGAMLALVWLLQWARFVGTGVISAPSLEALRLIAAMDTTVIAPTLIVGGVFLLRRRAWGLVFGVLGGVLGGLYACVLTAGAVAGFAQGLPGMLEQLPLWLLLAVCLFAAVVALLHDVRDTTSATEGTLPAQVRRGPGR